MFTCNFLKRNNRYLFQYNKHIFSNFYSTNNTINCKELADNILNKVKTSISQHQVQHPNFLPGLAVVQVGDRKDSTVYVGMKKKRAADVGIKHFHYTLDNNITQGELTTLLQEKSKNSSKALVDRKIR